MLTQKEREIYIEKGGIECPLCGREDLAGGAIEKGDAGQTSQDMQCNLCGAFWTDVYTLSNIVNVREPGADECQ